MKEQKAMAEHMTKSDFLKKVFDYEHNKEWKFQGELPVVIDFWAEWCGPCRMVGPIIDELSVEYKGKVNFYKVNTEQEQELAGAFGIQSIPSLLFVPKEGQPKMAVGALPKAALKQAIEEELLHAAKKLTPETI
jgi:thioredoxin 1